MKICFVPYFEIGNSVRYDSTCFFDDKMLETELMIIRHFSTIKNHSFIVKALKNTAFAYIIKDFIAKNHFTNIFFNQSKLNEVLINCHLAIIDYPSSAILEENITNIPTLVLSYKELLIREKALDEFKNISLFQYAKPEEIVEKIDCFISSKEIIYE